MEAIKLGAAQRVVALDEVARAMVAMSQQNRGS